MRAARFEQRLDFSIEARTEELIDTALPMLSRVTGERVRHELYLALREQEPERVLRRLGELNVLAQIHPGLACREDPCGLFPDLRAAITQGDWNIPPEENGLPAPGLYLALLTYPLPRQELESLVKRLKIFRDDLTLLHQVSGLKEREEDLAQETLTNREIYALLRFNSSAALLITWLCTESQRVRERLWYYETELRYIQPAVDGEYLKDLGLKPSPQFSRLLGAVRDARLDGEVQTEEEEKALIAHLLEEQGRASLPMEAGQS
jgi:tRNA nucleotidyltransferase (CCA-adding enzyme)